MALEDKLPGRLGGRPVHQRTTIKRATITPSAALISLITRILKVALFRSASYSKEVYHLTVGVTSPLRSLTGFECNLIASTIRVRQAVPMTRRRWQIVVSS